MSISGPIPLYNNVPIEPQNYIPWKFVITALTLGATTTVTVDVPSITTLNYVVGQQVRLIIPPMFGCRQLNNKTGFVIDVNFPNQIVLDLDSAGGQPFIASNARTPAQILAIGDINSGSINANGNQSNINYITGSFRNIS